jgi:hypothetical protein
MFSTLVEKGNDVPVNSMNAHKNAVPLITNLGTKWSFTSSESVSCTHWIADLMGSRGSLDATEKPITQAMYVYRNIQARSRNHACHGKAINFTYH